MLSLLSELLYSLAISSPLKPLQFSTFKSERTMAGYMLALLITEPYKVLTSIALDIYGWKPFSETPLVAATL